MKKTPLHPLLSIASLCMFPVALQAQPAQMPVQPETPAPVTPQEAVDTLQFRVMAGIERDDNILRSSTNEQSDTIGKAGVGLKLDKRYSLQRFRFDAEAMRYQYRNLSELNYSTLNYAAAWDWSFTPALHGVLSADRKQYRDVADTVGGSTQVSRRTDRAELFEGIYEIDGVWRALAGVERTSSTSTARTWDASPTVRSARVGVGKQFGTGSSVTARLRAGNGEYEDAAQSDFKEQEAELAAKWQATAKTSVDGKLAYLRRRHDLTPARDFSGPTARIAATWEATAKTSLTGGMARELSAYYLETGGYVVSNRFFVQPVWKPLSNVSVNARYQREHRNWRSVDGAAIDAGRRDVVQWLSAGVDYEPRRQVTLSGSVNNERRRSSLAAFSYRATTVVAAAKLTF